MDMRERVAPHLMGLGLSSNLSLEFPKPLPRISLLNTNCPKKISENPCN